MVMIMMSNIVVRSDPEADCCDVERVGDEVAHVPHVAHVPDDDVDDDKGSCTYYIITSGGSERPLPPM